MTREEFVMWMEAHDCEPAPIEGVNVTGFGVYYVNTKNRSRYIIMTTPIDDTQLPDNVIRRLCDRLLIPYPDSVVVKQK